MIDLNKVVKVNGKSWEERQEEIHKKEVRLYSWWGFGVGVALTMFVGGIILKVLGGAG